MIYKLKDTLTSAVFVVLTLLILSFFVLTPMLSMILLGTIFAYGIRPIAKKITPFLKFESLAVALAMIIVILPIIALIAVIINSIISSVPAAVGLAKNVNLSSINTTTIQQYPLIQQNIPVEYQSYITSLLNTISLGIVDISRRILNYLVGILGSIPTLAFQLFIFFASTFYFAKDWNKLAEYINYAIPHEKKGFFNNLYNETERVIKSIFYGHFLTAIIIGFMAGIGFFLLGYPYALFLGILAGFFQLIPIIGPWPTYTVLAIYDLITGNYVRMVIIILFGVFLSGSDIYIRPKISGKYADIHPLIFLLGFLCGPFVFGLVGFILGPLILGVTYAAIVAYKNAKIGEIKQGDEIS